MLLAGSALGSISAADPLACLGPIRRNCHPPWALDPPPTPLCANQKSVKAPPPNAPPFFIPAT